MQFPNKNIVELLSKNTLTQPKILIIEDCKCDTVLIQHILAQYYPYTLVDHSETKSQALQRLDQNQYDLILLDLNLPDTVNFDHIGEVREKCAATPLIIMTGSFTDETKAAAQKYGANGIISKSEIVGTPFPSIVETAADNVVHL